MKKMILFIVLMFALMFLLGVYAADAKVSGNCANCHTMHNSQDGVAVTATPEASLLVGGCVACHSSDTGSTIVNNTPIVYNTTGYPTQPLAGGNFAGVATDDTKGHNVYGISGPDSNLSSAPGNVSCSGNTNACHNSLAVSNTDAFEKDGFKVNGCQGCHVQIKHHSDTGAYRALQGHENGYVGGVEDPNWEQNPSQANHNKYKGSTTPGQELSQGGSMSAFCSGCHSEFHATSGIGAGTASSPWIRHPTDIALPETGEYGSYDPSASYDNSAPVAYTDPTSPTRATAVVMCLSCHRAHGSDQPDALRFDYTAMVAGGGGTGGCLACHTNKN